MNYQKESIEKRNDNINLIKTIIKKFLFILLIVIIYNTILITKSSLDKTEAKEIFGYKAYIITTQSMKPNLKAGDVIVIEKVGQEKLKTGDIITLNKKGETITHRIVDIQKGENDKQFKYITKGDNNNIEDSEVIYYQDIIGKKVLIIPLLGTIILLFKNKIYIILLILVMVIIGLNAIKVQKKRKIRREKKKSDDQKKKNEGTIEKIS